MWRELNRYLTTYVSALHFRTNLIGFGWKNIWKSEHGGVLKVVQTHHKWQSDLRLHWVTQSAYWLPSELAFECYARYTLT